jgi:hypothetical protein
LVKVSSPTITTPKNRFRATGYSKRGEITWTCYKGTILEKTKAITNKFWLTFVTTLVS